MRSVLIGRDRIVPVAIPDAGRYCVHKLALYSLRTGSDNPKRAKDVAQAALLAAAMSENHEFLLSDAIGHMDPALRSKVKPGAREAISLLRAHHPDSARQLEAPI